jgi:hypothetical protein
MVSRGEEVIRVCALCLCARVSPRQPSPFGKHGAGVENADPPRPARPRSAPPASLLARGLQKPVSANYPTPQ